MAETSASLLEQLRAAADGPAWRRLVDIYTPLLRGWLGRYGLQPTDCEDLVQEVLAVVVRELPGFEHNQRPGAFRRWLRTILVHRVQAFWRARQTRPQATGDSDLAKMIAEAGGPGQRAEPPLGPRARSPCHEPAVGASRRAGDAVDVAG